MPYNFFPASESATSHIESSKVTCIRNFLIRIRIDDFHTVCQYKRSDTLIRYRYVSGQAGLLHFYESRDDVQFNILKTDSCTCSEAPGSFACGRRDQNAMSARFTIIEMQVDAIN